MLDRIAVLGTSGSGKSTLAQALAAVTGAEHVDLDALNHGPNWQQMEPDEFRARVAAIAEEDRWIADGSYLHVTESVLWPRANLVIWLDLPLSTILRRLLFRTGRRVVCRRVVYKTELWNGNRESLRQVLSRDSILLWAVTQHRQQRHDVPAMLTQIALKGGSVIRFTHPQEVADWVEGLAASNDLTDRRRPERV